MSSDKCAHGSYKTTIKLSNVIVSDLNIKQMMARIVIRCALCGEHFIFKGPTGFSTTSALASPTGQELRAPIDWPLETLEVEPDGSESSH